jgi:hypothetical protein
MRENRSKRKVYRVEVQGFIDVEAESEDEAIDKVNELLPDELEGEIGVVGEVDEE